MTFPSSFACNCPTTGCTCGPVVHRFTRNGQTTVVVVVRNYHDNVFPELPDLDAEMAKLTADIRRLGFFRLARTPFPKISAGASAAPMRRAVGAERVDWARLPRRSPRGI